MTEVERIGTAQTAYYKANLDLRNMVFKKKVMSVMKLIDESIQVDARKNCLKLSSNTYT